MAKTINFNFKNKEYTLEFTRKSVETMEKNGFSVNRIGDMPMTNLPTLFSGAFLAHHKYVKSDVVEDIFSHMTEKEKLFEVLAEMYYETLDTLMSEPDEDEGNISWGTDG